MVPVRVLSSLFQALGNRGRSKKRARGERDPGEERGRTDPPGHPPEKKYERR